MKTRAAVLHRPGQWDVTELSLDPPKAREVLVRFAAAGLCHSDEHARTGAAPVRLPMVGGHEGAGVVEAVGPGVTRVGVGDHIVCSFVPVCGTCRYCSTGHQNMCDAGLNAAVGCLTDGTYRFHEGDRDLGAFCVLGTFSRYAVLSEWSCVKVGEDIPFDVAALVGCGVTTGWGSAVYAAGVRPGDTVVVFGVGGVGINAVQGASYAGAKNIVAVDPVAFKLESAQKFGATHATSDPDEAHELVVELTRGQLADHAILTVGEMNAEVVRRGVDIVGKTSQVTVTGVGSRGEMVVQLPGGPLTGWQKRVQGALFGAANPLYDIPRLLGLYRSGDLKLDELITRRYRLDQVNDGYRDMREGKNIRGVVIHESGDGMG
ncbi:MAG: NDMA-dependent alcohol dehydrogenase [Streptosporangiaceae bacterium]